MAKLERLENNKVKLTLEIDKEKMEEGIKFAYNKNKSKFNIPGFRKGRAPRKVIESYYGGGVFVEDAINHCLPSIYDEAVKELELDVVSRPEMDLKEISDETGTVTIEAEVYTKPEVTISEYKGLIYKKYDDNVSEDEIYEDMKAARVQNARIITIEDRPVENDDIVTIDFEGFVDDVPFEGGTGKDYELRIGSKTFIGDFEEQLIGHSLGEQVNVNVSFPEDYGVEELRNKPALFKVTINEIKYEELPELDDDFAQDVSEFDTFEEYKNDIREKLLEKKKNDAEITKENDVMEKLVLNTTVDLPEVMVDDQCDDMVRDMEKRLSYQGVGLDMYLGYLGQTEEELKKTYYEPAKKQVIGRLALEKIIELENIVISEEEIDEEFSKMAENYKMEIEEIRKAMDERGKEILEGDLKMQKALKLILEHAVQE